MLFFNSNKGNGTAPKGSPDTSKQKYVASLDIGTSKLCALIATPGDRSQTLNILGIGITESDGLSRGVVTYIDKTVSAIHKVIEQAEQQAGIDISEIVVGIAGDHIHSFQSRGIVGIASPNNEITRKDVDRVLEECRKIAIPNERRILHVIPQDFIIDGQDGITDPVGMSGVRMEANVHVVTGIDTAIQNIYRCVEKLNIKVKDIVLEPLASSAAILDEEEKEVGVAMIDIGGGTTDIAIFEGNMLRFTSVVGIAGTQVTDDIRKGLGIISSQAERIKREYGHAYINSIYKDDVFMIPGVGGRKPMEIDKRILCQIIQPRMEEIFEFALTEIRKSGYAGSLGAGIVITGGCSLLRGADELAQEIFGMQVKRGVPSGMSYSGLAPEVENPIYSTAVGLVMFGLDGKKEIPVSPEPEPEQVLPAKKKIIFGKVKSFFEEL